MRAFRAPTMTDLHERLCHKMVRGSVEDFTLVTSVDTQIHNVVAQADNMYWDFDLKWLWLTPSRWSMMVKQYLDPEEVLIWIQKIVDNIGTKKRGIAVLRTKDVKARGGAAQGNKETRRWGSCMLAVSYKALPRPQITLHSRTCYLGYIGALDMSVAWMLGKYLATAMGEDVENFQFVWMNEALQFHGFKSLAYLLCHPDEEKTALYRGVLLSEDPKPKQLKLLKAHPSLQLSRSWLQKVLKEDKEGQHYGITRYNTYRRIRRRLHTEVYGLEYSKQFEGWSYYEAKDIKVRKGLAEVGDPKEHFKPYLVLPHTKVSDLSLSSIGLGLDMVSR